AADALTLEATIQAKDKKETKTWNLPVTRGPGDLLKIGRAELDPQSRGGLITISVKRQGGEISTLNFIMGECDVSLLNSDGPVDPVYASSAIPALVPAQFRLKYVPDDPDHPLAPVIVPPVPSVSGTKATNQRGSTVKFPITVSQTPQQVSW